MGGWRRGVERKTLSRSRLVSPPDWLLETRETLKTFKKKKNYPSIIINSITKANKRMVTADTTEAVTESVLKYRRDDSWIGYQAQSKSCSFEKDMELLDRLDRVMENNDYEW